MKESNIELKREIDELKEINKQDKELINVLKRRLSETSQNEIRLEGNNVELQYQLKTSKHQLWARQERLEALMKEQAKDNSSGNDEPSRK